MIKKISRKEMMIEDLEKLREDFGKLLELIEKIEVDINILSNEIYIKEAKQ